MPYKKNMSISETRFYVYVYRHPDKGYPVWIGKGSGARAWDHLNDPHNKAFHDFLVKYPTMRVRGFRVLETPAFQKTYLHHVYGSPEIVRRGERFRSRTPTETRSRVHI